MDTRKQLTKPILNFIKKFQPIKKIKIEDDKLLAKTEKFSFLFVWSEGWRLIGINEI